MTIKKKTETIEVILMTYGSPKNLKAVPQYLKNVYGGKDASGDVIKEFQRRYHLIGGSPLVQITKAQAAALEKELNKQSKQTGSDTTFRVAAGMRFSDPFIKDVVSKIAKDARMLVGIIMSPQYSPIIMKGYKQELQAAAKDVKGQKLKLKIAEDWHMQSYFIEALAEKVTEALDKFPAKIRNTVPVLFSAHSMPKRVIDKEPNYIDDLKQTAAA